MTWRDILKLGRGAQAVGDKYEGKAMHFLKIVQSAFGAALIAAVLASPVVAKDNDKKPKEPKDEKKGSVGAPAPIAGAGLLGVVVVGGVTYLFLRRRRTPEQD